MHETWPEIPIEAAVVAIVEAVAEVAVEAAVELVVEAVVLDRPMWTRPMIETIIIPTRAS